LQACRPERQVLGMTLDALEEAVAELQPEERTALANWLNEQDMDEWDRQIQADFSEGGRGMHLLEDVREDVRSGKFGPLHSRRT